MPAQPLGGPGSLGAAPLPHRLPTLLRRVLRLLLALFVPGVALAQSNQSVPGSNGSPPPGVPYDHTAMAPVMTASPLTGEIHMDGVPDEEAWETARVYTNFTQREPDEGAPVSERTEIRILVGQDALYIGGRFFDGSPDQIRATLARRDTHSDYDYVTVALDTRHDHNTAFEFTLSPSGAFMDGARGADGGFDMGWDPVWEGAARMDQGGWSAEWRIPFSQLRFESSQEAEWGIQVMRYIARKQEHAWFAFTPLGEGAGPHRYGHLRGLGRLQEPSRLEILPYVTSRSEHLDVSSGNPFRSQADQFYNVGMDMKAGITSQLTLDATINPDFGQVEVDPAVVNLTAYETYFPERRPFFTEGAEIFRYGFRGHGMGEPNLGSLFYSRRIGRAPRRSLSDLDAEYVDTPDQTTIAGAAKISGRIGESWSIGLLEAMTLEEEGRYMLEDGVRGTAPVEPLSNYLVGRIRRDFRQGNSTVGGIFTAVNRDLREDALAETLHSSAYVAGVDFRHMWKNREWYVNGTLTGSRVAGSPEAMEQTQRSSARYWQRPDAGHVSLDPTRTSMAGWRGSLAAGRMSGDHWRGVISTSAQSPGFEANDLGFETRVDSWDVQGSLQYRQMEPNSLTRWFQVDFIPSSEWNFDGDRVSTDLFLGSIQQWANFWMSSTAISAYTETDNDRLTRGGPVARYPGGFGISQWISTDQRKSYSVNLNLHYSGNTRGGWGIFPSFGVTFRPSAALEVSLDPRYSRSHGVAQYVDAVEDEAAFRTFGSRYIFSDLDQTTISMDTRVSWTFTPHMSLQLFLQPFVSSGDYSDFKEMHEPRRWAWDIYGQEVGAIQEVDGDYEVDPDGNGPAEAFTLGNPDFNVRSLRGNAVLRWEYRPGSTLYLVWQQRRFGSAGYGRFDFRDDYDALFRIPPENVFALKVSYWWGG